MRRLYRLQAIGGSIYVAVPKEWLKFHGLTKGDVVEVGVEVDGALKIRPYSNEGSLEREATKIVLDVKSFEAMTIDIIASYLRGFDVIVLNFPREIHEKEVKNVINSVRQILLGVEVVDVERNSITLQVFSAIPEDLAELLRMMGKIARSMYLDVLQALMEGDEELAESIPLRDYDLNRLYFYVARVIRKKIHGGSRPPLEVMNLMDLRMVAKAVEEVGDESKEAAMAAAKLIALGAAKGNERCSPHHLKPHVESIDQVFRRILTRYLSPPIPTVKVYEDMRLCESVRNALRELRWEIKEYYAENYLWSKVLESYERIALRVYDMVSLIPTELEMGKRA